MAEKISEIFHRKNDLTESSCIFEKLAIPQIQRRSPLGFTNWVARANILQAVYRQVLPDIQLKDASGSPEVKGPGSSPGHILSAQKNAIGGEKLPN